MARFTFFLRGAIWAMNEQKNTCWRFCGLKRKSWYSFRLLPQNHPYFSMWIMSTSHWFLGIWSAHLPTNQPTNPQRLKSLTPKNTPTTWRRNHLSTLKGWASTDSSAGPTWILWVLSWWPLPLRLFDATMARQGWQLGTVGTSTLVFPVDVRIFS